MSEQHCQLERLVNEPITCNLLQDENVTKEIKYLKALTSQSAYMRRKGMINDYEIETFFYLMVTVYSSGIQGVRATLFTSSEQRQKIYSSYKNQLQIFTGNLQNLPRIHHPLPSFLHTKTTELKYTDFNPSMEQLLSSKHLSSTNRDKNLVHLTIIRNISSQGTCEIYQGFIILYKAFFTLKIQRQNTLTSIFLWSIQYLQNTFHPLSMKPSLTIHHVKRFLLSGIWSFTAHTVSNAFLLPFLYELPLA